MALLGQRRPHFWIGGNCDDIVDIYIGNFAETCIYPCAVEGVCVALVENDRHEFSYAEISEKNPLDRCRHFMAAIEIFEDESTLAATEFEQFMKARNRMIQGTVGYVDCGLDLMCMMLGLHQHQKSVTICGSS